MMRNLFGPEAVTSKLREGLDSAMGIHRSIAERIARANSSSANDDFAAALEASTERMSEEELVREVTQLADTEIRYQVEAKLLTGAYASIRKAIGTNG